jgi:hypothetical protein
MDGWMADWHDAKELQDEIKAKAVEEENLGDAADALDEVDSDDEDTVRLVSFLLLLLLLPPFYCIILQF